MSLTGLGTIIKSFLVVYLQQEENSFTQSRAWSIGHVVELRTTQLNSKLQAFLSALLTQSKKT